MRRRLSYSNVMASVAVFVALGGSAYAAVKITGKDVRNGSLTGRDIKDRSLARKDLKAGAIAETRWLLLSESGEIEEQSGGFAVLSRPGINNQPATNPNVYIDAGESLVGRGLTGTIAIQNRLDRDANGMPDPAFEGDVAVGRCNTGAINCVPTGTNVDNVLVVRALDDNTMAGSQTRRAYVAVTP
jgi:hypothetical protein